MARVIRMEVKLECLIEEKGVVLDERSCEDMKVIMEEDQTIMDITRKALSNRYFGSSKRIAYQGR